MKWIKYKVLQYETPEGNIFIEKKIGYNEENLAAAHSEAYNNQYTIEDDGDDVPYERDPLSIELGGTGAKTIEGIKDKLGFGKVLLNTTNDSVNSANFRVLGLSKYNIILVDDILFVRENSTCFRATTSTMYADGMMIITSYKLSCDDNYIYYNYSQTDDCSCMQYVFDNNVWTHNFTAMRIQKIIGIF